MAVGPSPPFRDVIAVPETNTPRFPRLLVGGAWQRWLSNLTLTLDDRPARVAHVPLAGQSASVATTPIPLATIGPGVWRVSYQVRVTTPASVSSSIQVTVHWTRGIAQSQAGAALVGNATTTREGVSVILRSDGSTPISYSTTYGSVGTPMVYELDVVAEELALDAG
jgi:hypothetical protein